MITSVIGSSDWTWEPEQTAQFSGSCSIRCNPLQSVAAYPFWFLLPVDIREFSRPCLAHSFEAAIFMLFMSFMSFILCLFPGSALGEEHVASLPRRCQVLPSWSLALGSEWGVRPAIKSIASLSCDRKACLLNSIIFYYYYCSCSEIEQFQGCMLFIVVLCGKCMEMHQTFTSIKPA